MGSKYLKKVPFNELQTAVYDKLKSEGASILTGGMVLGSRANEGYALFALPTVVESGKTGLLVLQVRGETLDNLQVMIDEARRVCSGDISPCEVSVDKP